ncbi:unnamed protein product [Oncorhynchus mykiss]|uniref:Ig-like domain-containing protein n=1 Tax=Oncorhynchus mykiss TaxID=8022 RepID=A0A060VR24_ONCMY|nr:unnamed protein product [Oncorhynchus mykiss]
MGPYSIKTYYWCEAQHPLTSSLPPSVSLLQKTHSSPVTCHATGFYPSGVMVFWQKDGPDHHEDVEYGETLPNKDGTFQKNTHQWSSGKATINVWFSSQLV